LTSIPNGASHAVNYKIQDFSQEVDKITNGHGADVIIDIAGRTHFEKNIASLADDGRMTILAFLSGAPHV
jgi:NADPH:quinone reductase-like Zn-dependent oxidoreductase